GAGGAAVGGGRLPGVRVWGRAGGPRGPEPRHRRPVVRADPLLARPRVADRQLGRVSRVAAWRIRRLGGGASGRHARARPSRRLLGALQPAHRTRAGRTTVRLDRRSHARPARRAGARGVNELAHIPNERPPSAVDRTGGGVRMHRFKGKLPPNASRTAGLVAIIAALVAVVAVSSAGAKTGKTSAGTVVFMSTQLTPVTE